MPATNASASDQPVIGAGRRLSRSAHMTVSGMARSENTLPPATRSHAARIVARLAALKAISPGDLVGETFVTVSDTAPVLRMVIDNYLKRSGINIKPAHEVDNLAMAMSLIASTSGVGLLPAYAQNFLLSSVTSRPHKGDRPTVELVLGYKKSNESPILKLLLSRLDELVARVSKKAH